MFNAHDRESREGPSEDDFLSNQELSSAPIPWQKSTGFYGDDHVDDEIRDPAPSSADELLKEISLLRERLKDLEDDGKSMVDAFSPTKGGNTVEIELRKELAKLEDDKARQELEFMNNIASMQMEKQTLVAGLKVQLAQAQADNDTLRNEMQQSTKIVKQMEQKHSQEITRLTESLKFAEEELATNSHDINSFLQKISTIEEENEKLQTERNQLQTEKKQWLKEKEELQKEIKTERDNLLAEKEQWLKEKEQWQKESQEFISFACNKDQEIVLELEDVKHQMADREMELEDIKEQLQEREMEIEELQEQLKERGMELEEARDETIRLQDQLNKLEHDASVSIEHAGEMNDSLIGLEEKCNTYQRQLQEARQQLQEQAQSNAELATELGEMKAAAAAAAFNSTNKETCDEEREMIAQTVRELEERLAKFTIRLREKEERIEKLQTSLREEKRNNHALKKELKLAKKNQPNEVDRKLLSEYDLMQQRQHREIEQLTQANRQLSSELDILKQQQKKQLSSESDSMQQRQHREIEQLKQANRQLSSELDNLKQQQKKQQQQVESLSSTPARSSTSSTPMRPPMHVSTSRDTGGNVVSPPKVSRLQVWPPTCASSPSRQAPQGAGFSPRTPVAGLVASFERGITKKDALNETTATGSISSSDSDDASSHPEELISELRRELRLEREAVAKLHEEMGALSDNTATKNALSSSNKITDRRRNRENLRLRSEIDRLEKSCLEYCREIDELRSHLKREKKAVHSLREEISLSNEKLHSALMLERKLEDYREENSRFQNKLDSLDDARKLLSKENEELRQAVKTEKETVAKLRKDMSVPNPLETKLREKEMELTRLRLEIDCQNENHQTYTKKIQEIELLAEQRQKRIEALEQQIVEEKTAVKELTEKLAASLSAQNDAMNIESELHEREQEIARMRLEIQSNDEVRKASNLQMEQLEREIARLETKNSTINQNSTKETQEEIERLEKQVEALQTGLDEALSKLEKKEKEVENLQASLIKVNEEVAEKARSDFVSTRDNLRIADQNELNDLRDALTRTQVAKGQLEMEYITRVKDLENEIEDVEAEAQRQIDELTNEVKKLEVSLEKRNEDVNRLENEKIQLCASMTTANKSRNNDFEELQSELIERTTKNASQAREIQSLKMKLEEYQQVNLEKQKLLVRVGELEEEVSKRSASPTQNYDSEALRAENSQLREAVREVKAERRALQERLESLVNENGNSKTTQVLRERNEALRQEVERLTRRLKKMEESITRFAI